MAAQNIFEEYRHRVVCSFIGPTFDLIYFNHTNYYLIIILKLT